ncbi:hypothetical protein P5V15_005547 [Pogonomyrmex californicus]
MAPTLSNLVILTPLLRGLAKYPSGYRNMRLRSDLSGSAYQRQFACVDTKEGSKSGDFMGRYPTGRFAKIVNQEDCTGGV